MPTSKPSIEANSKTYEVPAALVSLLMAIENTVRVGFTPTHENGDYLMKVQERTAFPTAFVSGGRVKP